VEYDFERMIEMALKESGDPELNQIKRNSNAKRSKTARVQSDNEGKDEEEKEENKVKKMNLKKRQKYDPRKAIEEAKKKEEQAVAPKSAFPKGMLKSKDRIRSTT